VSPRTSPSTAGYATLLSLAWPVVLARSSQAVIGFSDALMTAPLGEDAVAATTTGATNVFSLVVLPMGLVFIVQSFASQLSGKSDLSAARRYAWYGLLFALLTSAVAALLLPFVRPALGMLPYEPAVHEQMSGYMEIRLLAVGAIVGTEALGNWYAGLGNTRVQMAAALLAMAVNVLGNWMVLIMVIFWRGWFTRGSKRAGRLRSSEFLRMLRFGGPNGVNWFFEFAAYALFINLIVAHLGTSVLAALNVVIAINSVSFMPAFGMASAGAILAGQAIGRDCRDEVPAIVRRTATVAALWQCGVGVLYLTIPAVLMSWFAPPEEDFSQLVAVGTPMLAISAAWQLFDAAEMTLSEALRAAGDTAWTLLAKLAVAWLVFVPGASVSILVLGGGHLVATVWMVAYMAVLACVLYWRFRSGAWRKIDLTGDEIELA